MEETCISGNTTILRPCLHDFEMGLDAALIHYGWRVSSEITHGLVRTSVLPHRCQSAIDQGGIECIAYHTTGRSSVFIVHRCLLYKWNISYI